ncbi:MAG: hypothetical protein IJS41_01390 [Clostridia bacterium]|nr:hypothetical protein [Clostridia bacterium]
MKRYLNSERIRMIDENVHSDIGRKALKLKYINGKSLMEISKILNMPYSTFTDNWYNRWTKELFADFEDTEAPE